MALVLLIYATTHGHTGKIAGRLAETLRGCGCEVDLRDIEGAGDVDPGDYAAVVVGASVHVGRHQRAIVDWAKSHHAELTEVPSAFFSVSLTAVEDSDDARQTTQGCIDEFTNRTGWTPSLTTAIAGALQYREYDPFTRLLMRLKMSRGGHNTDTSHDHEYTDWESVDRFARNFASAAGVSPAE